MRKVERKEPSSPELAQWRLIDHARKIETQQQKIDAAKTKKETPQMTSAKQMETLSRLAGVARAPAASSYAIQRAILAAQEEGCPREQIALSCSSEQIALVRIAELIERVANILENGCPPK